MQHLQEGRKIEKYPNRHLENAGVWRLINIKNLRKRGGKVATQKLTQHTIVGLASGKGSKRVLERSCKIRWWKIRGKYTQRG